MFPLYALLTLLAALWLLCTPMPDERKEKLTEQQPRTSFRSCMAMLKHPFVLAMTVGILFSVGTDVGFAVTIPEYLKNTYHVGLDKAGMGPTVYFIAKTIAAALGAILFAKVSAAKCFPWCMAIGLAATTAMFFAGTPTLFLLCVFVAALMTANSFGMCMGMALDKVPEKANEISALMVMAIVGGAIITPVLGFAQQAAGTQGCTLVLMTCITVLLLIGLFSVKKTKKDRPCEK
jgi:fucose permease